MWLVWSRATRPRTPASSRLYPNIRKNSSADLRGSRIKSDITATASAPASMTDRQFPRVIPPMATSGLRVNARARRTPSRPITGSGFALLLSRKYRTDGEIVRRSLVGLGELFGIVGGNAQPESVADHCSGAFGREIVLPDVDSVEARRQAQVRAVVHDQFDGSCRGSVSVRGPVRASGAALPDLVAILQQRDAASNQFAGATGRVHRVSGKLDAIEDGVKPRKESSSRSAATSCRWLRTVSLPAAGTQPHLRLRRTSALPSCSRFFARNRSMNVVSIFPGAEFGIGQDSAVQRNRGVDAFDDEHLQRAAMREIASARSLPRTISLAISES